MSKVTKGVPFYDTNMLRVLRRVFVGSDVPAATAGPGEVIDPASGLVPPGRGSACNRAVMEFGALRCTARRLAGPPVRDARSTTGARPARSSTKPSPACRALRDSSEPKNEDTNQYLRGKVLGRLRAEANPAACHSPR